MKSTTFAFASLFAVAVAQPHRHQQHHHQRRAQDVVWVTDWDYVTETVDVTTTIWVTPGFVPPTTSAAAASSDSAAEFYQAAATTVSTLTVYATPIPSSSSVAPVPSTSVAPAPYVAPVAPAPAPSSTAATSAAPVYVAPAVVAPVAPVAPAVETPAPAPTPTPAPAPAPAPATVAAPVAPAAAPVAAPAAATTAAAAPVSDTSSSSGSSGGSGGASSGCTSGSPCEGDITYYQAGLGACGWTNDGDTENIVALPHGLMGTQSNGNPYCGLMITVKCIATGKTTTAKVVDKCMGCEGDSIDLSNAAFLDLDDLAVGRTSAEWWFN